jgi:8-oxo-dGTP diphosphatase
MTLECLGEKSGRLRLPREGTGELGRHRHKRKPASSIPTTRVSVIVISDDHKILLVRHRKGNKLYWVLPGGRLEYGETFQECGVRELQEETGFEVEVDKFLYLSEAIAPDRSRHIVNIYLRGRIVGGEMRLGNEPVLAGVDFIPLQDLEKITLFPPIAKIILSGVPNGFASGLQYLGNLWV